MRGARNIAAMMAPFPYFGGKSRAAALGWEALGNVDNFIEPFAGSLAVLLARPPPLPTTETVGDADCWIANFWRATKAAPALVAEHADWPVNEADYEARLAWFKAREPSVREQVLADPEWYDAKIAGWWVWGQSTAILGNWPRSRGIHIGPDYGVHARTRDVLAEMRALAQRLRRVRVVCGDFERTLATAHIERMGVTGVFLDPPYATERTAGCYATDDMATVSQRSRDWAIANGGTVRVVLAGYNDEHAMPADWRCVEWRAVGGMDRIKGEGRGLSNRERERLWLSPACLATPQRSLLSLLDSPDTTG